MAYDSRLADRLRDRIRRRRGWTEKAMFGGLGFLLHGHLCVGIWRDSLIARVGLDEYAAALREPCVREFDITGRSLTGWVLVEPAGLQDDAELSGWLERCIEFVRTLPARTG